ncbi:MAG: 4'-phosphopantetheinyl transferase superfamily protein [Phaeodactylibacter sp.]|uniref:4'-phosphopantetheinyl transferase family protein n=1 Tax=Phaeodactylibacter sp. TaxID=1940289 RepID=UPI0032ECBF74
MPLSIHHSIKPVGEIGIWDIEEQEDWFLSQLHLKVDEAEQLQRLKGRRRLEWLAARQLIHQMSGRIDRALFRKDEHGKPYLEGSPYQISISHSHEKAAAIAAPDIVGIDIQHWVPKIERLAKRFLNKAELDQLHAAAPERLFQLHVLWGAKESLYKAYGRRQLDFCQHMKVGPINASLKRGTIYGQVHKAEYRQDFCIHYQQLNQYILVYAVAGQNPGNR